MILEIGFVIVILTGLFFLIRFDNKYESELNTSGIMAIGTFERFNTQLVGYSKSYEYYYYDTQGQKHMEVNSKYMPSKDRRTLIKKGDSFLIFFNKKGAQILFDHPIKDSTDFKRYVKEFEQLRKQKAKE